MCVFKRLERTERKKRRGGGEELQARYKSRKYRCEMPAATDTPVDAANEDRNGGAKCQSRRDSAARVINLSLPDGQKKTRNNKLLRRRSVRSLSVPTKTVGVMTPA